MKFNKFGLLLFCFLIFIVTIGGVSATWVYATGAVAGIELNFDISIGSGFYASDGVNQRFLEILNGGTNAENEDDDPNNNDTTTDYEDIENKLDGTGGIGSGNWVSNTLGADPEDKALLDKMFTDTLEIDIDNDGDADKVTVFIKKQRLDGDDTTGIIEEGGQWFFAYKYGYELALFVTSDTLDKTDADGDGDTANAIVYASVFTKNEGSDEWYPLCKNVKGKAPITDYATGSTNGSGSFNTDSWRTFDGGQTLSAYVQSL